MLGEEPALEKAVALLLQIEKTVVEGAGAAGLAALLSASQSNVDLDLSANARVFAILSEEA